jgi:prepilin-type N-terminal cleavage/methylation domain-containing protein
MGCEVGKKNRADPGFTLIEVIIAFAIFTIVAGFVLVTIVGMFKSFHQGERMLDKRQAERIFLLRLNKEVSSVTKITFPENRFKGTENSFYFIWAKEDNLVETGYVYHPASFTLERYFEEPADFNWDTYEGEEVVLRRLADCRFSYGNNTLWQDIWSQDTQELPQMVRMRFRFQDEPQGQEVVVNIPVSQ